MNRNRCLQYWDMVDFFSLSEAAGLWCDADMDRIMVNSRGEPQEQHMEGECLWPKYLILKSAVYDGKIPAYRDGIGQAVDLTKKQVAAERLKINREDLKEWFGNFRPEERPAFLFDEARQRTSPDISPRGQLNLQKSLAIMAWLLAEDKQAYKVGGRPNKSAICKAVLERAETANIHDDGIKGALTKHLKEALEVLQAESDSGVF